MSSPRNVDLLSQWICFFNPTKAGTEPKVRKRELESLARSRVAFQGSGTREQEEILMTCQVSASDTEL